MVRWILGILACVVAAGVLTYWFWPGASRPGSGGGDVGGETPTAIEGGRKVSGEGSGVAGAGDAGRAGGGGGDAEVVVPASYEANGVVANPFPGRAGLAATLLTLDLRGQTVGTGVPAFAEACHWTTAVPSRTVAKNPVNLAFHETPLLDAMMQLEAQTSTGLAVANDVLTVRPSFDGPTVPGIWTVSGPFALVIKSVSHAVLLRAEGDTKVLARGRPEESFSLQIVPRCEPKLHILQYPGMLEVIEAVDERGHSLKMAASAENIRMARELTDHAQVALPLAYPEHDAGRVIKKLSVVGQFVVQTKSEKVEIANPVDSEATTKDLGSVRMTFGKMAWNAAAKRFEWKVVYQRGNVDLNEWATLSKSLSTARPVITGDPKLQYLARPTTPAVTGDQATANYMIQVVNLKDPRVALAETPAAEKVSIEVSLHVEQVAVPFEFHDLPLP